MTFPRFLWMVTWLSLGIALGCSLFVEIYKHSAHPDHRLLFAAREVRSTFTFAFFVCAVGDLVLFLATEFPQ